MIVVYNHFALQSRPLSSSATAPLPSTLHLDTYFVTKYKLIYRT